MNDTLLKCILCNRATLKPLKKFELSHLVKCNSCGMVFSNKVPSGQSLSEHYSTYAHFTGISQTTIKRYNEILDTFEKYRKLNRILDVGCGEGFFLEQAHKRGWEVYGTECVPHYINLCEKKSIHMKEGILDIRNYSPESFDVITSFEVIEHLNYPSMEMQNFNSLLRSGGLAYITTPNFNSLSRRIMGNSWGIITYPDHLSYFTPATLNKVLSMNGFERIKLLSTGISFERMKQFFRNKKGKSNGNKSHATKYQPVDMVWQERIEHNSLLNAAKKIINYLLTLSGTGDGLKALYRKS